MPTSEFPTVPWRDLAELVRAPAALSVPGDAVAGAAAAGNLGPGTLTTAAASTCLYWAGMAANDWADRELDAVERPERPIPSGRVSPGTALAVASGLTVAGLVLAGLGQGRRGLAAAGALAASVWAYDVKLKNTNAGPAGMALCRGLDVILGASTGRLRRAMRPALTVAAHTYLVTALSRREVSGADRSLPATTLAATMVVGAAAAASRRDRGVLSGGVGLVLSSLYAARFGRAQREAWLKPNAGNIRKAVGAGITSLPALQGALIAREGRPGTGALVAAAVPIAGRLARRVT